MTTKTLYCIWSWRNSAWYQRDRCGYSEDINSAGLYTLEQAAAILFSGLPGSCVAVPADMAFSHFAHATIESVEDTLAEWHTL